MTPYVRRDQHVSRVGAFDVAYDGFGVQQVREAANDGNEKIGLHSDGWGSQLGYLLIMQTVFQH